MTTRIGVQVPPGLSSGQSIQFQTPSGMKMQSQIPAGVSAGQTFYVDVPNAAPVAVAQAVHAEALMCLAPWDLYAKAAGAATPVWYSADKALRPIGEKVKAALA